MSTQLMGLCWPLQMSPAQKAVLISLADQANDEGFCWPSMRTLAKRTCLSERAVRNAIRWLEENGYLSTKGRSGTSSYYQVTPPKEQPEASQTPARRAAPKSRTPAPDAAPAGHAPPAPDAEGAAPDAGGGGSSCPLIIIEPSLNQSSSPRGGEPFAMFIGWQPGPRFGDRLQMSGVPPDRLTPAVLGEFVSYRATTDEKLTQSQWEHKLLQNLLARRGSDENRSNGSNHGPGQRLSLVDQVRQANGFGPDPGGEGACLDGEVVGRHD